MRRPPLRTALLLILAAGAVRAADVKPRLDLYGDPLPTGAVMRMGTVRLRVGGPVLAIAADNKTFVALDTNARRLVLWDVKSGLPLRTLDGEADGDVSATFTPDG